jgi:Na+-translocating ferredoxin:NAD+ oxidoreductase RnfD subunit
MSTQSISFNNPLKRFHAKFLAIDPRYIVLAILLFYLALGFTVLGFNRSPFQALVTTVSAGLFEIILTKLFKKKWIFPLSAIITSVSLSLLINYSQNYWILFIPVFFAIGSKHFFTFNGKHNFNPAQIAVTLSLLFSGDLITAAPAYQWYGIESMAVFIFMFGVFFLLPKINRHWLVLSFLFFFTLNTFLRAMIMKHHLPFETLFLGTLTSPAFFLFTFFMITDPQTSPKTKKGQIIAGFAIALVDLIFHLKQSYFTFFYAASTIQLSILIFKHGRAAISNRNPLKYFYERFYLSGYIKPFTFLLLVFFAAKIGYTQIIKPRISLENLDLKFEQLSLEQTGINPTMGKTLERVDPRIQHLAKWLISVGDTVAAGDVNNDGLMDYFYTFPLKDDKNRNSLYINQGEFKFEKFELPIKKQSSNIEKYGLASSGSFVDLDNDGDKDLFLSFAFGSSILLKNLLVETGSLSFVDITKESGLDFYTNSINANFFDFNNDGRLDIIIGNVWPENLKDYPFNKPEKLNLFKLPEEEYPGDERMFNFMHASWNKAVNGGKNILLTQNTDGTFKKLNSDALNLKETKWTLAIGTADFNDDGWIDLYVANDFGADDLYYNREGKSFENIKGEIFGSIGRDTYKGMNATIADFDHNGISDVYISNVHHAYQAEGSLLWMFSKDKSGSVIPTEKATTYGILNESRFGWGAAAGDLNLDGHVDLVQANGMVDDTIDKKWDDCPDYWYVNEKIARSAPSFHRYTNKWGDIRGFCIYGKEKNRVYLNQGDVPFNKFVDVADYVGLSEETNSRGVSFSDLNNDGRLDIAISHMFSGPSIYKNSLSGNKSWLGIDIESLKSSCNREAAGSKVTLSYKSDTGLKSQMIEKVIVNGFNGQSENRLLFGLGSYTGPVDVMINWCLKDKMSYTINSLNQYIKIRYE